MIMENRIFRLKEKLAVNKNGTERREELNICQFGLKAGMVDNHSEDDGNLLLLAVVKKVMNGLFLKCTRPQLI